MAFECSTTQEFDLTITGVDRLGKPAELEDITFISDVPAILTVTQSPTDPTMATCRAAGQRGACTVRFTADGDLGDGVVPLAGSFDAVVVSAGAVGIQAVASAAREQAAP